jgi:hypothetical protein
MQQVCSILFSIAKVEFWIDWTDCRILTGSSFVDVFADFLVGSWKRNLVRVRVILCVIFYLFDLKFRIACLFFPKSFNRNGDSLVRIFHIFAPATQSWKWKTSNPWLKSRVLGWIIFGIFSHVVQIDDTLFLVSRTLTDFSNGVLAKVSIQMISNLDMWLK